jgi:L-fuculose-phosphate aldolase
METKMILENERIAVVEYGKKLVTTGLVKGTFGNISIYNREQNLMAISPSGKDYFETTPEDIVVLRLDGEIVDGKCKPSSEYDLHRIFYQRRTDVNAVVHTHSTYATILSCLQWEIEPVHYLIAYAGDKIPCTPYVPFGSYELAEITYETMGDRNCCLLGNHGLVACGSSIAYAFDVAEQMEFLSELYYKAKLAGEPKLISSEYLSGLMEKFKTYRV